MSGAANEAEWAADRKVGFAMGILLVGVVAALFFRNEPLTVDDAPAVTREEQLDARLRDRNVSVYRDDFADPPVKADSDKHWTLPDMLNELSNRDTDAALPIGPVERRKPAAEHAGMFSNRDSGGDQHPPFAPPEITSAESTQAPILRPAESLQSLSVDETFRRGDSSTSSFGEYTVRYGDTLSGIAERTLGSPNRYRDIFEANRDRMSSPDQLRVGEALRIPRL